MEHIVSFETCVFFLFLTKFQISRFVSINKLKYFFAVDTKYVIKKLILLMFPYTHQVNYILVLMPSVILGKLVLKYSIDFITEITLYCTHDAVSNLARN